MTTRSISERSSELRTSRVPFVHARVVFAERPTSAKPGDEALILGDGTMLGFVGGACAESTVREQSLATLAAGGPRLLRITPLPEDAQDGKTVVVNPCLSGGTLEIFLQPAVPPPLVVVAGDSPIADALVELGTAMGYELRTLDREIPDDTDAVVVASHGRGEEEAVLTAALRAGIDYVGLVASPKRGEAVLSSLEVEPADRARVDTPAGLDIGGRTAHEIACSILAGMIQHRARHQQAATTPPCDGPTPVTTSPHHDHVSEPEVPASAVDPVCGMSVPMVESSLHLEHAGTTIWFCAPGCKRAFAADPAAFGA
jgi:xanthine dehydrogenase accessory factor